MILPTHFISCDWGTTNFRLRLVVSDNLKVLAEHTTDLGVRGLNDRFIQSDKPDRLTFFATYLHAQLAKLPPIQHGTPIVISGMASANIGMCDLAYGDLPIGPDGVSFVFEDFAPWAGQQIRLISGVKSATGMMRGEETQALGLLKIMKASKDGTLLLPGTHSKHLTFRNGEFTDFTSFMTGELFEIISQNSILSNSVAPGKWNTRTGVSFKEGVMAGFKKGLTPNLFAIRAGQVLRQTESTDNFYQLSGLLIGDELAHLPPDKSKEIYLAGSGPLLRLYRYALEVLGTSDRLTVYDEEVLSEALLSGQREMLMRDSNI
jgi:2-dehydro-3-deoxygalactonokinase